MSIALEYGPTAGRSKLCLMAIVVAALGMLIQVGHFAEHAAQFFIWTVGYFTGFLASICGPDRPWVSELAMPVVEYIGSVVAPTANSARRMMLGMETLHLIGNSLFLTTIGAAWLLLPKSSHAKWAFIIEGLHLCEHLMLTMSAFTIGTPIGVSTLFGQAGSIFPSKELVVGYRVSWHFAMNLLPMPLVMMAFMNHSARQEKIRYA